SAKAVKSTPLFSKTKLCPITSFAILPVCFNVKATVLPTGTLISVLLNCMASLLSNSTVKASLAGAVVVCSVSVVVGSVVAGVSFLLQDATKTTIDNSAKCFTNFFMFCVLKFLRKDKECKICGI